jgi:hypothetical protein
MTQGFRQVPGSKPVSGGTAPERLIKELTLFLAKDIPYRIDSEPLCPSKTGDVITVIEFVTLIVDYIKPDGLKFVRGDSVSLGEDP